MDLALLEKEVLGLDVKARGRLASKLLRSLDDISDEENEISTDEIERLWIEEAHRRCKEMESGKVVGQPVEDVLRDIRLRIS